MLKGWNHLRFIYSLLDLPTQGFECHWNLVFRGHQRNWHKMLLDEESAGGSGLSTRLLSSQTFWDWEWFSSRFNKLIWSFPSVRMQCEASFQALSSGANPPVNIDSGFWRTAEKMTSQWSLLPSLPVSSREPSGARRRRNKRKKKPKTESRNTLLLFKLGRSGQQEDRLFVTA